MTSTPSLNTPKTPQPRPHQVDALLAVQRALALHDRAQLIMACGTGKTFVGRWHAQACDAQLVLVLLPSLSLVSQTLTEWRRATGQVSAGWRFRALVVCSDPTTATGEAERTDAEDAAGVDVKAWEHARAEVTTDPEVAARFLRDPTPVPRVVFSTYHSAPVVAAAQALVARSLGMDDSPSVFDLVICDEAHRLAGHPSDAFAHVLDARQIVARKRLFMTATPKPFRTDDGFSMDDPAVFGPVAHTVTFGEAIAAGMLTDYQVLVIEGRGGESTDRNQTVPTVLAKAVDSHGVSRVLTFHGRVGKAAGFAASVNGVRTPSGRIIAARHVSGAMATSTRTETLEWLAEPDDEVRVVSNARCLSEGVDVPAVDAVMFADQRSSIVDIIQAVGRVLRPSPGKKLGTIILPVGLDDGDDDTSLAMSHYTHVWTVLRGLRAHDQRLADDVDELVRDWAARPGSRAGGFRIPRIDFVIPNESALNDLHLRAVTELGSAWERHYGHLMLWAQDHDGKLIPRMATVQGDDGRTVYLGEWCQKQRVLRRRGALDQGRSDRLAQIPGWAWDKAEAWWSNTFQLLVDYADIHGTVTEHTQGESRFAGMKSASYPKQNLGIWAAHQRHAHRLGTLPDEHVQALETLPGWDWAAGLPDEDVAHVEALRQFVEFEKHARVPDGHLEDGLRLAAWCWNVRLRHLTGRLAPALLDEILAATPSQDRIETRFPWEAEETMWRLKYFALKQFAAREGHARANHQAIEECHGQSCAIGAWSSQQRFKHRRGDLLPERVALLEALPGWEWDLDRQRVQATEPVDLTGSGTDHGRPGAWARPHFCKCGPCLAGKREAARKAASRKAARVVDPVPTAPVREHLMGLEARLMSERRVSSNGRTLVAAVADVPLGILRKVITGQVEVVERSHADQLMAVTFEVVMGAQNQTGSRGRDVSDLTARVDSAATFALLDDLAARGFGIAWVSRELGYATGLQIRRGTTIQARLAAAVTELHDRVGDLTSPPTPKNVRQPSLAELMAAA